MFKPLNVPKEQAVVFADGPQKNSPCSNSRNLLEKNAVIFYEHWGVYLWVL